MDVRLEGRQSRLLSIPRVWLYRDAAGSSAFLTGCFFAQHGVAPSGIDLGYVGSRMHCLWVAVNFSRWHDCMDELLCGKIYRRTEANKPEDLRMMAHWL